MHAVYICGCLDVLWGSSQSFQICMGEYFSRLFQFFIHLWLLSLLKGILCVKTSLRKATHFSDILFPFILFFFLFLFSVVICTFIIDVCLFFHLLVGTTRSVWKRERSVWGNLALWSVFYSWLLHKINGEGCNYTWQQLNFCYSCEYVSYKMESYLWKRNNVPIW